MSELGHAGSGNCNWTLMYSLASAFPPANRRSFKFVWTPSEERTCPCQSCSNHCGGGGLRSDRLREAPSGLREVEMELPI
eukprot:s1070_g11.t1